MTMACNMELARQDTILKYSALHLNKHDRNCLRRSGFTPTDPFSPSVLNNVENNNKCSRSPKRQNLIPSQSLVAEGVKQTSTVVLHFHKQKTKLNSRLHNTSEGFTEDIESDFLRSVDTLPGDCFNCANWSTGIKFGTNVC